MADERADQQGGNERRHEQRDRAPELVAPRTPQVAAEQQHRRDREEQLDRTVASFAPAQAPLARVPSRNLRVTSSPMAIRLLTHFRISSLKWVSNRIAIGDEVTLR